METHLPVSTSPMIVRRSTELIYQASLAVNGTILGVTGLSESTFTQIILGYCLNAFH